MEKNKVQESIERQELFVNVKISSIEKARNMVKQYLNKRQEKEGECK